MDLDELFPSKPDDPLVALAKQDLDPVSIEELHARIAALKAEIARVEAHITKVQAHRSAAEELFKKGRNRARSAADPRSEPQGTRYSGEKPASAT